MFFENDVRSRSDEIDTYGIGFVTLMVADRPGKTFRNTRIQETCPGRINGENYVNKKLAETNDLVHDIRGYSTVLA